MLLCVGHCVNAVMFVFTDIDECSYNPCHQVCSNTAGSYQCSCTTGFTLDTDDNTTCNGMFL